MREIETSANSQRVRNNGKIGCGDSSARPQVASMKALKLPPYNEDKDDLDAYLSRFEHACMKAHLMFSLNTGQHNWPDYYKVKPWMFISACLITM